MNNSSSTQLGSCAAVLSDILLRSNSQLVALNEKANAIFENNPDRLRSEMALAQSEGGLKQLDGSLVKSIIDACVAGGSNIFQAITNIAKLLLKTSAGSGRENTAHHRSSNELQPSIATFIHEFKYGFILLRYSKKSDISDFLVRVAAKQQKKKK